MKADIKLDQFGVSTFSPSGDLDYHASTDLRTELLKLIETGSTRFLISFQDVSYIDSACIAAFVEFGQKIKAYDGRFVIYGLNADVDKVFRTAKLHLFFKLAKDREEALTLIGS